MRMKNFIENDTFDISNNNLNEYKENNKEYEDYK